MEATSNQSSLLIPPVSVPDLVDRESVGSGHAESTRDSQVDLLPRSQKPTIQVNLAQIRSDLTQAKILIIDDDEFIIRVLKRFLTANGYSNFVTVTDSKIAIETIRQARPDLVLLDINLPDAAGIEILTSRSQLPELQLIPILVLSENEGNQIRQQCLQLGATDFLNKPIESAEISLRVLNALTIKRHNECLAGYAEHLEDLVRQRTDQLERSREHLIHALARAAEYRDNETDEHITRVGRYSAIIAEQLGFDSLYCRQIELSSQLHDVGKIGVPDSILLSKNKLSQEEFEIMKTHCQIGIQIMAPLVQQEAEQIREYAKIPGLKNLAINEPPMLAMALEIARTHHEKWDGTGYPAGLIGEQIPISGRIVCVADVFDALCSDRPYKPRFTLKQCLEIMISERGTRFDPAVLDAFFDRLVDIEKVRRHHQRRAALRVD